MSEPIFRQIRCWKLSEGGVVRLLTERQAEEMFGIRIYNLDRPRGLVPVFEEVRADRRDVA